VLSGFDASGVAKRLQCGDAGDTQDRCLIGAEACRLARELVLAGARALRERASADAEDLVAILNRLTSAPVATIVPATSSPGTGFLGRRKPKPMMRIRYA